jgi:hypothetical protein
MDKAEEFNNALVQIDADNKEYFLIRNDNFYSIRKCFAIVNDVQLVYMHQSKLSQEIYELVVNKHKQIYGNLSVVVTSP